MPQIGTLLLANVFSALLPPIDPDEVDYYDILGVAKDASNEKIRKAYKVQSLKLHPDKVAQRGETNREEAAAKYEKVQEAYGVLVNEEKRQRYNALNCSPTRYRFVSQGALANPGALYQNLTGASFTDKTRLVILASIIITTILVQPILIAAKINQSLEQRGALEEASWIAIFIPYFIIGGLIILFLIGLVFLVPASSKLSIILSLLEHIAWFIAVICLSNRWDGDGDWAETPYRQLLIPVYIAMVLQWLQSLAILQKVSGDVRRMVSPEYMEKEVLKGKSLEEHTEEEQEELRKKYFVVTVPADFEPIAEDGETLDDKRLEELRVESSPEYEAATDIYGSTFGGLVGSLVFVIVFLILLTLKLDRKIDASWWTVFVPLWVYYGSRLTYSMYGCMCTTISGDEIILQMGQTGADDDDDDKDGDKDDNDNAESRRATDGDKTAEDRPSGSGFLHPEASFSRFNKSGLTPKNSNDEAEEKKKRASVWAKQETDAKKKGTKKTTDDEPEGPKKTDPKKDEGTEEKKDDDADDDDDPHIGIDEDTFRAWQSAYDEAERGAAEQQAKAATECCSLTIRLLLICMIVAKIEKNFDSDDPDDVGFNTFWILSPFFLFFGIIFCCCACLIYGAEPGDESDLVGGNTAAAENDEENPANNNGDTPIVLAPPPPATTTTANTNSNIEVPNDGAAAETSKTNKNKKSNKNDETDGNDGDKQIEEGGGESMEELD